MTCALVKEKLKRVIYKFLALIKYFAFMTKLLLLQASFGSAAGISLTAQKAMTDYMSPMQNNTVHGMY